MWSVPFGQSSADPFLYRSYNKTCHSLAYLLLNNIVPLQALVPLVVGLQVHLMLYVCHVNLKFSHYNYRIVRCVVMQT